MEDLPPLRSLRHSSRAPSRQSFSPDRTESHLYVRDMVRESRQRSNFTAIELLILDDHQICGLSHAETIFVPLSCSTLNALAAMMHQLDTITTQPGNIQGIVATLPTWPALQGTLAPINLAIRDLSHRVSAPPSQAPAPTRAQVPHQCHHTTHTSARSACCSSVRCHHKPCPPDTTTQGSVRCDPRNRGSSSHCDPGTPRYDPDPRSFYGDHRTYAVKSPDSWEANAFREGNYPDPATCIAGHLAPDCPKPQPSYAKATSSGAPKGNKNKSSLTAAKVASASNSVPATQGAKSLPTAQRRFYAPRSSPSEHPQAALIAATFSVGESPWLPFHLAPNKAQLAIHSLPIAFLPEDENQLFPCLSESILNSKNIRLLATWYLNSSPQSREGSLPPLSSSLSTLGTSLPWAPPSVSFHARLRLRAPTPLIGTRSARTAGDTTTSPAGALLPTPSAP